MKERYIFKCLAKRKQNCIRKFMVLFFNCTIRYFFKLKIIKEDQVALVCSGSDFKHCFFREVSKKSLQLHLWISLNMSKMKEAVLVWMCILPACRAEWPTWLLGPLAPAQPPPALGLSMPWHFPYSQDTHAQHPAGEFSHTCVPYFPILPYYRGDTNKMLLTAGCFVFFNSTAVEAFVNYLQFRFLS